MDFGLYEVVMLILVVLAHLHGIYEGKKGAISNGVEVTLRMLEAQGVIKVDENGDITPVCNTDT